MSVALESKVSFLWLLISVGALKRTRHIPAVLDTMSRADDTVKEAL